MKGIKHSEVEDLEHALTGPRAPDAPSLERIGQVLRRTRVARGMLLKDIAAQVGCSISMLSKIENGRASPSLRILHAVMTALGSNIAALFDSGPDQDAVVYRKGERHVTHVGPGGPGRGVSLERLIPFSPGRVLEGNIHVVMPGANNGGPIRHTGEEAGFVLDGELELKIGDQTYTLRAGDSFFFKSEIEHSYRNVSTRPARVLWINTPPTF